VAKGEKEVPKSILDEIANGIHPDTLNSSLMMIISSLF